MPQSWVQDKCNAKRPFGLDCTSISNLLGKFQPIFKSLFGSCTCRPAASFRLFSGLGSKEYCRAPERGLSGQSCWNYESQKRRWSTRRTQKESCLSYGSRLVSFLPWRTRAGGDRAHPSTLLWVRSETETTQQVFLRAVDFLLGGSDSGVRTLCGSPQ